MVSSLEVQTVLAPPTDTINMDLLPTTMAKAKQPGALQTEAEEGEEGESNPPLLQPDPCRLMSCLRAPCLKKQNAGWSSGSVSPTHSTTPPGSLPALAMTGIKTLCSAAPKRQVHFDAAPPEAGLTYSGDRYDRRPIECTQGGSQSDLSLPPRGTCTLYTDEADDEACIDEDDEEENKQKRLQGFAKWAKLKNGASSWMGASSSLKSKGKKESEEAIALQESNSCSTPIHGIRAFGKLAGQSGLASPNITTSKMSPQEHKNKFTSDEDISEEIAFASGDEESESEDRHEAFRKAVYAALSKDPNATPMPSPSVRPRWECITSYFEPIEATEAEQQVPPTAELDKSNVSEDNETLSSGLPLSKEQEASKVANWTQDQANNGERGSSIPVKAIFGLTLPPPKCSPSLSLEGSSSLTNRSSSPMSSRCSSSDAWGSESGGGHWSGSEVDAFDAAFSKGASVVSTSPRMTSRLDSEKEPTTPSSPNQNNTTPKAETVPTLAQGSPPGLHDSEPHDVEHTSSSSSGGGPGWMSSCCTSPEMAALDGEYLTGQTMSAQDKSIGEKMTTLQNVVPLLLERRHSSDGKVDIDETPIRRSSLHLYQLTNKDMISMSEGNTPHVLSCDEEETNHKTLPKSLRCPIKKMKKARRTTSGDGKREDASSERGMKPAMLSRSKSTNSSTHKKASAFQSDFDDEGALGGF